VAPDSAPDKAIAFYSGVACAGTVTSMSMMLLYARGWADYMWISPLTEVLCQLCAAPFLNLATPMGVLRLESVRVAAAAVIYGSLVARRFFKSRQNTNLQQDREIELKSNLETLVG
jgi:hypothetical protein